MFRYGIGCDCTGASVGKAFVFRATLGGASPTEFVHEFGHQLGVDHGGVGIQGMINCKPNYPSIMNYAFAWMLLERMPFDPVFSLGARPALNPVRLVEAEGVGPDNDYVSTSWDITADGDALDWNRDGTADTNPTRIQLGYPLWRDNGFVTGCSSSEYHQTKLRAALVDAYPDKSPSVVAYDGRVYLFYWRNDERLFGTRFTPDPALAGDLRRCASADVWVDPCGSFDAPSRYTDDSITSSPMFVHHPTCTRADGVAGDRLVGIFARGRDADAVYELLSVDSRNRRATRSLLLGTPPPTFANQSPYTDDDERAVADPAITYHRVSSPDTRGLIFIVWRHFDGAHYSIRQMVLDDHLDNEMPTQQVLVGGVEIETSDLIGRDPALLSIAGELVLFYIAPDGQMKAVRWLSENHWQDVQDVLFGGTRRLSATQPGLAAAGRDLPAALRLEYRDDFGVGPDPFPLVRTWTDGSSRLAFEGYVRNSGDADYRGAVRLSDFGGTEVAAVVGLYDPSTPLSAGTNCTDCDCHTGMRRLSGGGYAGCGRDDADHAPDLNACFCPNARGILFRPFADGVINAVLEDHDDWSRMASRICVRIRGCEHCTTTGLPCPPGTE